MRGTVDDDLADGTLIALEYGIGDLGIGLAFDADGDRFMVSAKYIFNITDSLVILTDHR